MLSSLHPFSPTHCFPNSWSSPEIPLKCYIVLSRISNLLKQDHGGVKASQLHHNKAPRLCAILSSHAGGLYVWSRKPPLSSSKSPSKGETNYALKRKEETGDRSWPPRTCQGREATAPLMPALVSQACRGTQKFTTPPSVLYWRGETMKEEWGSRPTSHLFRIQHGQSFHSCQNEILGNFSPESFHADKKHPGGPQPVRQTLLTRWQRTVKVSPNYWKTEQVTITAK